MATTETANKPLISGIATEEQTFATRYSQGGRTVYGLALSPAQVVNMIPRPDPDIPNPGNRKINTSHATAFAHYYLTQKDWVIPGIILRAPSIFSFDTEMEPSAGVAQWGILSYPKRESGSIHILDGQHRILGFHIAMSTLASRIEKARDFRSRAQRTAGKGSPEEKAAQKELDEALALMDRFSAERVSVEIQVTDDARKYRQMFFDIADNALTITASVKVRFDTTKIVNRALIQVLEHPLFANRTDLENNRVGRTSGMYATAKNVADITRAALVGVDGRVGKVTEREGNDSTVAQHAKDFLDAAVEAFPQLAALQVGQVSAEVLRTTSLLGSPAFLRILAGVYFHLSGEKAFTREQIVAFFKALDPHMAGGAHAESIWITQVPPDKQGVHPFNVGAFAPNGRRQDLVAIEKAIVDWAVLGKKGAPFVWAKPAPAPTPEPTAAEVEEEEVLAAQISADPELEALLAQSAELDAKLESSATDRRRSKK